MWGWAALQYHCSASHSGTDSSCRKAERQKGDEKVLNFFGNSGQYLQPNTPYWLSDFQVARIFYMSWVQVSMTNIAALLLQWCCTLVNERHTLCRHILAHSLTGWMHQLLCELAEWRSDVKKGLTWAEHRISAASGYNKPQPTRLYCYWLRKLGGVSMTQLQNRGT